MKLMALLKGKEYAEIVTGAEQAPNKELEETEYAAYIAKCKKAWAIIVNPLGDKPVRSKQSCTLPSEMWESSMKDTPAGRCQIRLVC